MADLNSIGGLHYEMMRRCYNPKSVAYKDYGEKGIVVCEEWHDRESFKKWCSENGWEKGLRINRMDSSKGYSPDNCFLGESNKAKNGYSQFVKRRAKENKKIKNEAGLKKYSDTPLFGIYHGIITRCYNPKFMHYKNYGGRGIAVCSEWIGKEGFKNFYLWAIDNGYKEGLSIDRIDNDKGYYPENCRWVDFKEQINNRRNTLKYLYQGKMVPLGEIARIENVKYGMLYSRLVGKGMSLESALSDIKS